jgi:hypothetical protein
MITPTSIPFFSPLFLFFIALRPLGEERREGEGNSRWGGQSGPFHFGTKNKGTRPIVALGVLLIGFPPKDELENQLNPRAASRPQHWETSPPGPQCWLNLRKVRKTGMRFQNEERSVESHGLSYPFLLRFNGLEARGTYLSPFHTSSPHFLSFFNRCA